MIWSDELISAIFAIAVFGFTGSLHCSGMCGPLAAAACVEKSTVHSWWQYHVARILSYGILGFLAGFLGHLIFRQGLELSGRAVGIVLGSIMTVYASLEVYRSATALIRNAHYKPLSIVLKEFFQKNISRKNSPDLLNKLQKVLANLGLPASAQMGVVTAFLPCGFLYAALAQATVVSSPASSTFLMIAFAISTTPALLAGTGLAKLLQRTSPKFVGILMSLLLLAASLSILMRGIAKPHNHSEHAHHSDQDNLDEDEHHDHEKGVELQD